MWYFWLLDSVSDRESHPDGELTEKDEEREYVAGDAYNNKPVRRWLTHIRGDTHNNGPVQWLSETYVCPNCVKEPDDVCCQDVPDGLFCTPDSVGLPDKTPEDLNDNNMCEKFRDPIQLNFNRMFNRVLNRVHYTLYG